jgi:drug/metabolite transporter (DMT)-like permease
MQKEIQFSNQTTLAKWFLPYVLVASLQYQFTKDGLIYASPFVLMSFRYVIVGIVFFFIGGRKLPLDKDSILVAFFSCLSSIFWAIGLSTVSPGDSAVLSYTMPLFSIPLAYAIIRERASFRELLGASVGFGGVVVYSLTLSHNSQFLGAFYTILGAVFWGAYSVYYRKLRGRQPFPILTTQFLIGSIPLLIGTIFFSQIEITPNLVFDLSYIVVFTGLVQFYFWNGLLRRGRVGRITTLAFAVPAVTVLIDYFRHITVPGIDSIISAVGAALMFIGIFVSNWHKQGLTEQENDETGIAPKKGSTNKNDDIRAEQQGSSPQSDSSR